ncbi:efflux RND transporter permease subunit [Aneurinibacillus sp. REN35]|uniref:efflux RND transporter permease subunit n=1 Tax=Aneurinibacillus sp. REN35 TaxID=3237286 RepID=UPI003528C9F4
MNSITKFSLRNPSAIFILALLVAFGGAYSASGLKQEIMPDVTIPVVAVITPFPGASTSDITEQITEPTEKAVKSVNKVKNVTSTSTENISAVIAEFPFSVDMEEAKRQVEEAVREVKRPEGAIDPQIKRISFGSFPIMKVSISNKNLTDDQIEKTVKDTVMPSLTNVSGVGQINISTQKDRAIYIRLLPDKLKEHNLTLQQVQQQIQANNIAMPITSLTIGDKVEPIRVSGKLYTLEDLKNIKIAIAPNQQAAMQEAFQQIGENMGQIGQSVGQLGQGMAGMNQAFNAQMKLLNAIGQTQSKIFEGKLALQQTQLALANPLASAEEKKKAGAAARQLTTQIQTGEAALQQMQSQLKQIQAQMDKMQAQSPAPKANEGGVKQQTEQKIKLIPLSELAEIKQGTGKVSAISRTNGTSGVALDILKNQDSNTVDVTNDVKAKLTELKAKLPKGSDITVTYEQATQVKESIDGMLREGMLGALFASLVILLFLRNFRSTLIAIVSIPLSILIAMLFLRQFNITLNVMTLGGLAIAVGRVVDDSIVVIENIYRNMQEHAERTGELIRMATKEVSSAITSSTLTTVAVFLPLGFVEGIIGKIFLPFALTVVFSLLASLLVAVTVVPALARFLLLRQKNIGQKEQEAGRGILAYQKVLDWSLDHKFMILLISTAMLAASLSIASSIGTGFLPASKEKFINIAVEYPIGMSIAVTDKKAREIEQLLAKDPSVMFYQTSVGTARGSLNEGGNVGGSSEGKIFIRLKEEADVDTTLAAMKQKVQPLASHNAKITVTQFNPNGGGQDNTLQVVVNGNNMEDIRKGTEMISKNIQTVRGLAAITNNLSATKPEIEITVDQAKAAKNGLSGAQIMGSVREMLADQKVGALTVDNETLDIQLGTKLDQINSYKEIAAMKITAPTGKNITLADVADVRQVAGPVSILHRNGDDYATVDASITDKDVGLVSRAVQTKIDTLTLPPGVTASIGGSIEQMSEGFKQLGVAIGVAIIAVYLVMVIAFGELLAPLAILFSLPLAIIGGIVGLYIADIALDIPAMIGALMLIGIVVTNAIVLVDRVQQQRNKGRTIREALIDAGTIRMRPILMTAIATICALLPLALGFSGSSLISQSLAVVVIGGLTTSTLLTLVVVPVAYELLHWKTHHKEQRTKAEITLE